MKNIAIVIFICILMGCDQLDHSNKICYYRVELLDKFINELELQDIKFARIEGSKECIKTSISQKKQKEIHEKVFGKKPPEKFSMSWPIVTKLIIDGKIYQEHDQSERILSRLKDENIQVEFINYLGHKFIVWKDIDDIQIRKIINDQPR